MGRAQGQSVAADQFAPMLGARRGIERPDLAAAVPSQAALLECERLVGQVRHCDFEETLRVLARAGVEHWERPQLAELARAVNESLYEEQRASWQETFRRTLTAAGVIGAYSRTLLAYGGHVHVASRTALARAPWEPAGKVRFACGQKLTYNEAPAEVAGAVQPNPRVLARRPRGSVASSDTRSMALCVGCMTALIELTPRQIKEAQDRGDKRTLALLRDFDFSEARESRRFDPFAERPQLAQRMRAALSEQLREAAAGGEQGISIIPIRERATETMRTQAIREAAAIAAADCLGALARLQTGFGGVDVKPDAPSYAPVRYPEPSAELAQRAGALGVDDWERALDEVFPADFSPAQMGVEQYAAGVRAALRSRLLGD